MSTRDDHPREMDVHAVIDDTAAEALLAGRPVGDPALAAVAGLVAEMRSWAQEAPPAPSPALAAVLAGAPQEVPATASGSAARRLAATAGRRRLPGPLGRLARQAAAAGLAAKVALGAGMAAASVTGAAATGVLPDPVRDAVSGVVRAVTPFELPGPGERQPDAPGGQRTGGPATDEPVPGGGEPPGQVPGSLGQPGGGPSETPDGEDGNAPPATVTGGPPASGSGSTTPPRPDGTQPETTPTAPATPRPEPTDGGAPAGRDEDHASAPAPDPAATSPVPPTTVTTAPSQAGAPAGDVTDSPRRARPARRRRNPPRRFPPAARVPDLRDGGDRLDPPRGCFATATRRTPPPARAITRVGPTVHLGTAAEGVETPAQLAELQPPPGRRGAGSLLAAPAPPAALGDVVAGAGEDFPEQPVSRQDPWAITPARRTVAPRSGRPAGLAGAVTRTLDHRQRRPAGDGSQQRPRAWSAGVRATEMEENQCF